MKKISSFVVATLFVIAISCSKNQQVVNRLEGEWKITAETKNGVAQPDSTFNTVTYKFEKCKVKKGDCGGTMTDSGKGIPFTYNISEKGKKISFTIFGIVSTGDIIENSKKKFTWRMTDNGDVTETTIEKK